MLKSLYINIYAYYICVASSDSDYTGLALRIREEGLFVMGIGRRHTAEAFVQSCESFTYSEAFPALHPKPVAQVRHQRRNDDPALPEPDVTTSSSSSTVIVVANPPASSSVLLPLTTLNDVMLSEVEGCEHTPQVFVSGGVVPCEVQERSVTLSLVDRAFNAIVDIRFGYVMLSSLSQAMRMLDPLFTPRRCGYNSLKQICSVLQPEYKLSLYLKEWFVARGSEQRTFGELDEFYIAPTGTTVSPEEDRKRKRSEPEEDIAAPSLPALHLDAPLENGRRRVDLTVFSRVFEEAACVATGYASLSSLRDTIRKYDPYFSPLKFGHNEFLDFCNDLRPDYLLLMYRNQFCLAKSAARSCETSDGSGSERVETRVLNVDEAPKRQRVGGCPSHSADSCTAWVQSDRHGCSGPSLARLPSDTPIRV